MRISQRSFWPSVLLWACCVVPMMLMGSCGAEEKSGNPRIGFVSNGVANFWVIAKTGAEAAGRDVDASVEVYMPAEGISSQKRILEDLLIRGFDGIAVSPIDPLNQTQFLNKVSQRTRLITHDSDAPDADRLCYIGMDNYEAGRLCGQAVKEALPSGGDLVFLIGRLEQDNGRRRRQGLIDELLGRAPNPERFDSPNAVLEGGGYRILGTLTDQFDRAKGKANAEDAISRYPGLDAMVGMFEHNTPLILEALRQAGKMGEIMVIGFDEAEETLQGVVDGAVYATIVQDPYAYGYRSVEILTALTRGDRSVLPASGFLDIPARMIGREEVRTFWDEKRRRLGDQDG